MERRAYFVLGDLATNVLAAFVGETWDVPLLSILGVLIGFIVGIVISFAFMPLFGAFEVMLPTNLSGMAAGMCIGTYHAWHAMAVGAAAGAGAIVGVASFAATYILNTYLHDRGWSWTSPLSESGTESPPAST